MLTEDGTQAELTKPSITAYCSGMQVAGLDPSQSTGEHNGGAGM